MSVIKQGDKVRLAKKMPNQQWQAERTVLANIGDYLILFSDLSRPDGVLNIHAVKTSTVTKVEPPKPKAKPGVEYCYRAADGSPYVFFVGLEDGCVLDQGRRHLPFNDKMEVL